MTASENKHAVEEELNKRVFRAVEEKGATLHTIRIVNESHKHAVPRDSETHFNLTVVSNLFQSIPTLLARHRFCYTAAGDLMQNKGGSIHALSLHPLTEEEWIESGGSVEESPPCAGKTAAGAISILQKEKKDGST